MVITWVITGLNKPFYTWSKTSDVTGSSSFEIGGINHKPLIISSFLQQETRAIRKISPVGKLRELEWLAGSATSVITSLGDCLQTACPPTGKWRATDTQNSLLPYRQGHRHPYITLWGDQALWRWGKHLPSLDNVFSWCLRDGALDNGVNLCFHDMQAILRDSRMKWRLE